MPFGKVAKRVEPAGARRGLPAGDFLVAEHVDERCVTMCAVRGMGPQRPGMGLKNGKASPSPARRAPRHVQLISRQRSRTYTPVLKNFMKNGGDMLWSRQS